MADRKPESSLPTEHVTVDSIEGKYARVELPNESTADWLLSTLPSGVKEGDVLVPTCLTTPSTPVVIYYNCAEARAAGATPLLRGQPGYNPTLDRDGDGKACK